MGREGERNGAGSGSGSGSTNGVVTDTTPLETLDNPSPPAASPPLFPTALRGKGKAGIADTETNEGDHDGLSRSLSDAAIVRRRKAPGSHTSVGTLTASTTSYDFISHGEAGSLPPSFGDESEFNTPSVSASPPSERHSPSTSTQDDLPLPESQPDDTTTSSNPSTSPPTPDLLHSNHPHHAQLSSSSPAAVHHTRQPRRKGGKFTDLVFTHNFSAFDRQNPSAANSPFHGFFTLFWMAVFLFVVKIAADNWRAHGNPLGTNEIMRNVMFRREVVVLLAADGLMCGLTGVSWLLQLAVREGFVDWDGVGWVLQNVSSLPLAPCLPHEVILSEWRWVEVGSVGDVAVLLTVCVISSRSGRPCLSREWSG
jgi:hypothetical protein